MSKLTATDIRRKVEQLYTEELEILPEEYGGCPVFDKPDVRIASAGDQVIADLKNVIGSFHWSPQEALDRGGFAEPPEAASVVSWCLPVSEASRKANRKEDYYPSNSWAWTRTFGENMNDRMRRRLADWLTEEGWPSTVPTQLEEFGFIEDTPVGIASPWSERHYAWAAGHGTFGISGGLITRRGIAHRLGSVVTSLDLEPDVREYGDDPFSWCLKSAKGTCGVCIKRCPVGSIGETNALRDKEPCNEHDMKRISAQHGVRYDWEGIYGCGLCQTAVPCEFRKP